MELDNVHHLINDDQMVLLLGWLSLLRRTKRQGSVTWSQAGGGVRDKLGPLSTLLQNLSVTTWVRRAERTSLVSSGRPTCSPSQLLRSPSYNPDYRAHSK